MEKIEIELNYNKQLLRDAYRIVIRRNSFWAKKQVLWVAIVILIVWFIWNVPVDSRYFKDLSIRDLQFPVMFAAVIGISHWQLQYHIPNKMADSLLKYPEFQNATKWVISEEKINITTLNTNSEVQWNFFQKAFFTKKFILLYSNRLMYVLPVDCFKGNDLELFKAWVKKNIRRVIQ